MKKLLFVAAIVSVVAVSCSKDRTCTCTTTVSGNGASASSTDVITLVGSTKSQAKANCVSTKQTYTTGTIVTSDCKLN